jgi:hypothetical protein
MFWQRIQGAPLHLLPFAAPATAPYFPRLFSAAHRKNPNLARTAWKLPAEDGFNPAFGEFSGNLKFFSF